jgi:hypothetical protein
MKTFGAAAILVNLILWTASPVSAQFMSMGLKGGASLSTASIDAAGSGIDAGSRQSFHGGAVINYSFGSSFSVQAEALIGGKGFEPDDSGTGATSDLDLSYFSMPVLAMVSLPTQGDLITPRVFVGPALSLRATCHLTPQVADPTQFTDCDADISKTFDFGMIFGGGIRLGKGTSGFTVDVSYDYGLMNISDTANDVSVFNRTLLVSLGFVAGII